MTFADGASLVGNVFFDTLIVVTTASTGAAVMAVSSSTRKRSCGPGSITGNAAGAVLQRDVGSLTLRLFNATIGGNVGSSFNAIALTGGGTADIVLVESAFLLPNAIGGASTSNTIVTIGLAERRDCARTATRINYGSTTLPTIVVYQPGGTLLTTQLAGNVFFDWNQVYSAVQSLANSGQPVELFFDGTHNSAAATIPAGTWDFTGVSQMTLSGPVPAGLGRGDRHLR